MELANNGPGGHLGRASHTKYVSSSLVEHEQALSNPGAAPNGHVAELIRGCPSCAILERDWRRSPPKPCFPKRKEPELHAWRGGGRVGYCRDVISSNGDKYVGQHASVFRIVETLASGGMSPTLLNPPTPRRNSQGPAQLFPPQSVNDGFEYQWTAKNPGRDPTKPADPTPPPVGVQEAFLDLTANAGHEDQDRVFTETSPHIFQRKQGGWNARLPDVDIGDSQDTQTTNAAATNEDNPLPGTALQTQTDPVSTYLPFRLTWRVKHVEHKRTFLFSIPKENGNSSNEKQASSTDSHESISEPNDPDTVRRVSWRYIPLSRSSNNF